MQAVAKVISNIPFYCYASISSNTGSMKQFTVNHSLHLFSLFSLVGYLLPINSVTIFISRCYWLYFIYILFLLLFTVCYLKLYTNNWFIFFFFFLLSAQLASTSLRYMYMWVVHVLLLIVKYMNNVLIIIGWGWAWYHELSKPRSVLQVHLPKPKAEADNTDTRFW